MRFVQIFALVQMMLVISIALVNALYVHRHILPSGEVIIHAHPFNQGDKSEPFENHTHSRSEYVLFMSIFYLTFVASFLLLFLLLLFCTRIFEESFQWPDFLLSFLKHGRAPPMAF
ncbi:MAG: hypothetical protein CSA95_02860 [Bacteroidetes bacterium]|nr:MAG: hypothetical protein CSA95_02860 [Bacteroidota bacterium]